MKGIYSVYYYRKFSFTLWQKTIRLKSSTKDGARIRMNAAAFEIAEKHFGVTRSFPAIKETPVELLKLPKKVEVIKAAPKDPEPPAPEVVESSRS